MAEIAAQHERNEVLLLDEREMWRVLQTAVESNQSLVSSNSCHPYSSTSNRLKLCRTNPAAAGRRMSWYTGVCDVTTALFQLYNGSMVSKTPPSTASIPTDSVVANQTARCSHRNIAGRAKIGRLAGTRSLAQAESTTKQVGARLFSITRPAGHSSTIPEFSMFSA